MVTSIIHGEQSVPAIGDVRMVQIPAVKLGDVYQDDKIDIKDARKVLQAVSGNIELTDEEKAAADVYEDGNIDIRDAKRLLQAASGSIEL